MAQSRKRQSTTPISIPEASEEVHSQVRRSLRAVRRRRAPEEDGEEDESPSTRTNRLCNGKVVEKPAVKNSVESRIDPKHRGIHPDAIAIGRAPSRASTCVACGKRIEKLSARWGIKYGGNPLPIPVLPLYGQHPMILWCHPGGCGLSYTRFSDLPIDIPAARTCHACQYAPDTDKEFQPRSIRLLCGGMPDSRGKIRHHAFHVRCWRNAIHSGAENFWSRDDTGGDNVENKQLIKELYMSPLLIGPSNEKQSSPEPEVQHEKKGRNIGIIKDIWQRRLGWNDLSDQEQEQVLAEYS